MSNIVFPFYPKKQINEWYVGKKIIIFEFFNVQLPMKKIIVFVY